MPARTVWPRMGRPVQMQPIRLGQGAWRLLHGPSCSLLATMMHQNSHPHPPSEPPSVPPSELPSVPPSVPPPAVNETSVPPSVPPAVPPAVTWPIFRSKGRFVLVFAPGAGGTTAKGAREVMVRCASLSSVAEVGASRPEILLYSAYLMRRRCDGVNGGMVAAL